MTDKLTQVVFTDKARCRDCYRCLRVCPVKAIELHDGQARVVAERCIACGTCIRECPQHAKSYRNDLERAMAVIRDGYVVAASVAPSFAAVFGEWERRRLPSALRKLGFNYVAETAIGAFEVAKATAACVQRDPDKVHICTACPAVVNYVEQYQPQHVDALVPVVSPMLAHAQHIRAKLGPHVKTIFIGPCVAKKAEADRPEHASLVYCALTFAELQEWLRREKVDMARLEESEFDEAPPPAARYFPVPGGLARTAGLETDVLNRTCQAIDGHEALAALLDYVPAGGSGAVFEPLFCAEGCIRGPGMPAEHTNTFTLRAALLKYAAEHTASAAEPIDDPTPARLAEMGTTFAARPVNGDATFTEEQIRATLQRTGRADPADQLNCGACGYASCRDNAIAVLRGMAEPDMCIPYMRLLAERRTDRIIETSPNGIVTLDHELRIIGMNPSFRRMFVCSEAILGKPISYLMDPEPFERLAAGGETIDTVARHPNYNLVCHQMLYALPEDRQYVGIFANITSTTDNAKQLADLRAQTQAQAKELMEHQVDMSQQIAKLLGETTARGEALVRSLLRLAGAQHNDKGPDWLQDTYTSK
ncbi:MAG: [Fe-Fe] hydrogenase large subunit C-terminal domain-containing protein [Phycisphaerae bacterium]|jgi:iron only hydrogenase large subunit-like protein